MPFSLRILLLCVIQIFSSIIIYTFHFANRLLYEAKKTKKKGRKQSESDEDMPLASKKKGGKNGKNSSDDEESDEESDDEDAPLAWTKKKGAKNGKNSTQSDEESNDELMEELSTRKFYGSKSKRGRPSRSGRRNGKATSPTDEEGSSEDVPLSRKPGPLSKTRPGPKSKTRRGSNEAENGSKRRSSGRRNGNEENDGDFDPAKNGKKTLQSDEDEEEEEDESVDEELKKQLADEVENQNKSGHLDMSTTEDIKLSREGRKWNGKKIPPEQPLLISGGIMKPYQIEGMIWMANLRKAGANGIVSLLFNILKSPDQKNS